MPALAQETEEKDGSASSGSLPTVQVKASAMQATTGMELSMRQTPQSVTVVSKPVLREQGITGMAGAMRSTTGINVLSETDRVRFQSRGFYIDQIQEDGISSTVPGSSGNPARDPQSMTDLAVYEHIEVLRGPHGPARTQLGFGRRLLDEDGLQRQDHEQRPHAGHAPQPCRAPGKCE